MQINKLFFLLLIGSTAAYAMKSNIQNNGLASFATEQNAISTEDNKLIFRKTYSLAFDKNTIEPEIKSSQTRSRVLETLKDNSLDMFQQFFQQSTQKSADQIAAEENYKILIEKEELEIVKIEKELDATLKQLGSEVPTSLYDKYIDLYFAIETKKENNQLPDSEFNNAKNILKKAFSALGDGEKEVLTRSMYQSPKTLNQKLFNAASYGKTNLVQKYLSSESCCKEDIDGLVLWDSNNPLLAAAERGYVKICELLVLSRAKVNIEANNFDTPLVRAAYKGSYPTLVALVSAGAKTKNSLISVSALHAGIAGCSVWHHDIRNHISLINGAFAHHEKKQAIELLAGCASIEELRSAQTEFACLENKYLNKLLAFHIHNHEQFQELVTQGTAQSKEHA